MDFKDIRRRQDDVEKNIDWIEEKTSKIFQSFESIKDCFSKRCIKKKKELFDEFNLYLNRLKIEEDNITKMEKEIGFRPGYLSGIND